MIAFRPIGRANYIVASMALLAVQYAAAFLPGLLRIQGTHFLGLSPSWLALLFDSHAATQHFAIGLCMVIVACAAGQGFVALRRAATVDAKSVEVAMAVVPWLQLIAIPVLALRQNASKQGSSRASAVVQGAFAGLAIALLAEILFTLLFSIYGVALFVGTPFVVGLVSAYLVRRTQPMGIASPLSASLLSLLLAAGVLFGFALEGLFCLAIVFPLAMIVAVVGGAIGIGLADLRASRGRALSSVVLLPMLLVSESYQPPHVEFADTRSIAVAAPPSVVWRAIVNMGTINQAPAAPFGWGLAYPVAGRIDGRGVGAIRLGIFSTGTAYERVTQWVPDRQLWFKVLSDPPMMREANPFGPVQAPHLDGYFLTRTARFTLTPLPGGGTRLTLVTEHVLRIGPTTYFLPLAQWAVAENKRRVLSHFRDRALRFADHDRSLTSH